jgi:hypothetical protein
MNELSTWINKVEKMNERSWENEWDSEDVVE